MALDIKPSTYNPPKSPDFSKMSDDQLNQAVAFKQQYGKLPHEMTDEELDHLVAAKKQDQPWIDQPEEKTLGFGPRGTIKGLINSLPTAGMIGGGFIGSVPGAGYGAGMGESLKNTIYSALGSSDAPQTSKEAFTGPLKEIPVGMAGEMGGQIAGKIITKYGPRLLSSASGAPEQDVNTLIKNPEEVGGIIKETEGKVSGKIDEARRGASDSLKKYKDSLNRDIKEGIAGYGKEKTIDINPILESIGRAKEQVNPKLNPEVIAEINAIQKRVSDLTEGTGKASVSEINEIRSYLGDLGSGSAPKPTGEGKFFSPKDPGSRAAYYGSGAASDLLKKEAPEVGAALSKFGKLRELTKSVTPGLLKEGANDVGFLGAGRGAATRNENALKSIDEITGGNVLGEAQKLSAAKTFGDTQLNPLSIVSGGLLKNPAILREAVFANQSLGGAPAAAAQFSSRPAIMQTLKHRPDVKEYQKLGHGK